MCVYACKALRLSWRTRHRSATAIVTACPVRCMPVSNVIMERVTAICTWYDELKIPPGNTVVIKNIGFTKECYSLPCILDILCSFETLMSILEQKL